MQTLPTRVDIIKHRAELNGKSTAIHCAVTAPNCVRIYDYPPGDFDDYRLRENVENTVIRNISWNIKYLYSRQVLFYPPTPNDSSSYVSIEHYVKMNGHIDRMLFLDASWHQVPVIRRDSRLKCLPTIALSNYTTEYWRPQKGRNDEHLATVEAVYYALREYDRLVSSSVEYDGRFDDLLFWFYHFRDMVIK